MKEQVITFLVENNQDILYKIVDYVRQEMEYSDDALEDIVREALKVILEEHFDLNFVEIYDILNDDITYKEPFNSLYFRKELYDSNKNTLH